MLSYKDAFQCCGLVTRSVKVALSPFAEELQGKIMNFANTSTVRKCHMLFILLANWVTCRWAVNTVAAWNACDDWLGKSSCMPSADLQPKSLSMRVPLRKTSIMMPKNPISEVQRGSDKVQKDLPKSKPTKMPGIPKLVEAEGGDKAEKTPSNSPSRIKWPMWAWGKRVKGGSRIG